MFGRASRILLLIVCAGVAFALPGCRLFRAKDLPPQGIAPPVAIPNPLPVPLLARELVMDEISDEIDNYLPILTEERIRNVDGILSEGWIETRPQIGGSIFEPWKRDSTPGFEKLHATLQSVRRFAKVRVIPTAENYLVDLRVYKELEDLPQPIGSTVSGRPLRVDNSLDIDRNEVFEVPNQVWIPMGRDFSLEQTILQGIQARMYRAAEETGVVDCQDGNCG